MLAYNGHFNRRSCQYVLHSTRALQLLLQVIAFSKQHMPPQTWTSHYSQDNVVVSIYCGLINLHLFATLQTAYKIKYPFLQVSHSTSGLYVR